MVLNIKDGWKVSPEEVTIWFGVKQDKHHVCEVFAIQIKIDHALVEMKR